MKKERCKDGKKYMLITAINYFGPRLVWADKIKDFRVCDIEDVSKCNALLMKSDGGNVVRIKANGAKWY